MTPEEIRKQMMGSAGVKEEDAESLYAKADSSFSNKNYSEAFALAQRAAGQGHAAACNFVGVCYANGFGVEKSLPHAKVWFERAAKGGLPRGIRNFALAVMDESCGPPDYATAAKLLNEADEAGDRRAPGILARLYLEGREVEKDLTKAVDLLKKGIDRGDEVALFDCSICYRDGVAVEKDLQKALSLAKLSREKGYEPAGNLAAEIEAEIQGKPLAKASASEPPEPASVNAKPSRKKSMPLALVLAFFFGPFGLFYVSWKRALFMLLLFIVGVFLIPKNEFVVLLLWLVVPILSIIAGGVGRRQDEPTPDEAFWSGNPPAA